jgi:hypothetical protein
MTTLAEVREALLRLTRVAHGEYCSEGWESCRTCAHDRALLASLPADGVIVDAEHFAQDDELLAEAVRLRKVEVAAADEIERRRQALDDSHAWRREHEAICPLRLPAMTSEVR